MTPVFSLHGWWRTS
ncbi:trp operon leader peptide [Cronobacter turicensis]|nr:trp operon leader peptide [Cronobacter turicensis]NHV62652.1 trp operon leader peptide [Cronobacter turicensis]NHW09593.1 trp operon leader peptide [Cronobacter turicensis]